jgi:hypothetical protein
MTFSGLCEIVSVSAAVYRAEREPAGEEADGQSLGGTAGDLG